MLYFQLVIMAGTVMLAYYFEYTDTFTVHVQGFFCYDTTYTKPYLGPEDSSAVPPILLYAAVAGLPTLLITITETMLFLLQYMSKEFDRTENTVATGDCCYLNPLVRRTFRFLGVYTFGLFTVDIFVNAGQVVTGNLAPYFLTVCKPNYTALGCQQALRYISHQEACTGNQDDVLRARKTFPSKEAALSVYAALYLAVVCVVHNFKGKLLLNEESPAEQRANTTGQTQSPLEKYIASQETDDEAEESSCISDWLLDFCHCFQGLGWFQHLRNKRITSPSLKSHDVEPAVWQTHWTSTLFTIQSS
ncbi:phospholipid phosphatase-related protein type 5-like isoform X3 [Thalassophryne amazonica]|uniref:phospholipid phosphatase-related protein type 5-like isoform X3 n=1 Tax=Thalassophryne amazonica TaxID=390379 RepID=UPI0014712EC8|nr:phospholipid phosphatase-related protein type 5-like isoform X3 [Thalassophryne amazonica]